MPNQYIPLRTDTSPHRSRSIMPRSKRSMICVRCRLSLFYPTVTEADIGLSPRPPESPVIRSRADDDISPGLISTPPDDFLTFPQCPFSLIRTSSYHHFTSIRQPAQRVCSRSSGVKSNPHRKHSRERSFHASGQPVS